MKNNFVSGNTRKRGSSELQSDTPKRVRSEEVISNLELAPENIEGETITVPFDFFNSIFALVSNMNEYQESVSEEHEEMISPIIRSFEDIISIEKLSQNKMASICRVAIKNNNTNIIRLLYKKDMDILSIDDDGNTFLHLAVQTSFFEAVELLASIDQNLLFMKNRDGDTALEVA